VGGQCNGTWGFDTVKTLKFEKVGGCMTPPASMVAPPVHLRFCNVQSVQCAVCTMCSLWITDGFSRTERLCTGSKRAALFTTSANQATLHFERSNSNRAKTGAKGFWLYYDCE